MRSGWLLRSGLLALAVFGTTLGVVAQSNVTTTAATAPMSTTLDTTGPPVDPSTAAAPPATETVEPTNATNSSGAANTTEPPGPPATPPPTLNTEMAPSVITGMRSAAAVVSLLTAPINPSLCPHAARVSLIIDQSRCRYNTELNQIEVVFYPIQVGFADDRAGKYFAAAIILWPFAMVFLIAHYILVVVKSSAPKGSSDVEADILRDLAMQRYKFPSLTVSAMALFFWQPLIMSAVTVLVHGLNAWTRVGAFGTLIFALGFGSFLTRWYFSRRQLIEFVPFSRYYFRRHAFNSLVLRGGDVTKLLGILSLPPVEEPKTDDDAGGSDGSDDDARKKKKKKKDTEARKAKKNKEKKQATKKAKAKQKHADSDDDGGDSGGDDRDNRSDGSSSSEGSAKKNRSNNKKNKGKAAIAAAAAREAKDAAAKKKKKSRGAQGNGAGGGGGRAGGEDAQPMTLAERARAAKNAKTKKASADTAVVEMDAEDLDIAIAPLSRAMKQRVQELLMRDWQERTADELQTAAEQAKLQRGVGLPSLPNAKKGKKAATRKRGTDDSTSSSGSDDDGDDDDDSKKPRKPLPKWMNQAPWLQHLTVLFAKAFVGRGRWADVPGRYGFSSKNGFMFQHYGANRHWFMLVELLFCTAFGALEGVKPLTADGCWRVATSSFALLLFYVLLVVALRPFLSLWNNVSFALVALQQAASCALLLAAGEEYSAEVRRSGEVYAFACLSVVILKGLADVGGAFYLNGIKRKAWKKLRGEDDDADSDSSSGTNESDGEAKPKAKKRNADESPRRRPANDSSRRDQPLLRDVPTRVTMNPLISPRQQRRNVAKEDEEINVDF